MLQKRGYETSTEAQQPNDFYQIELPELNIPTVVDPETSILRGLERRKIKDEYNNAYDEYMQNNEMNRKTMGVQDPDLGWIREPYAEYNHLAHEYAKEKTGYDLGDPLEYWKNNEKNRLTTAAIALSFPVISGISAGALGTLPKLGLDLSFAYDGAKTLLSPEGVAKTARFVRQGKLGRAALSGAGDLLDIGLTKLGLKSLGSIGRYAREVSDVAKFNRWNKAAGFRINYPWQKATDVISINTEALPTVINNAQKLNYPKYLQISNTVKNAYQTPSTSRLELVPKQAFTSDFSGVENVEPGNFGYEGQKPNLGLRKLRTEQRSKQLLDSVAEEEKRNAVALNWYGKNWNDLGYTDQYWLKTNHGNEWNDKLIVPR